MPAGRRQWFLDASSDILSAHMVTSRERREISSTLVKCNSQPIILAKSTSDAPPYEAANHGDLSAPWRKPGSWARPRASPPIRLPLVAADTSCGTGGVERRMDAPIRGTSAALVLIINGSDLGLTRRAGGAESQCEVGTRCPRYKVNLESAGLPGRT